MTGVAGQGGPLPTGERIPDPHRLVPASAGQPAAIRRRRQRSHPVGVAGQGGPLPTSDRIPDPHRLVPASAGQPAAIRRHRQRHYLPGVAGQHAAERGSREVWWRPPVDQPRSAAYVTQSIDLGPPAWIASDPAVQDIHHRPRRLGGRKQKRRACQHRPQPSRSRCANCGQISRRGSWPEPLQPRPHPAQITSNGISLVGPRSIAQMLDEVIPQVPILVIQAPPRYSRRPQIIGIQRARCAEGSRN